MPDFNVNQLLPPLPDSTSVVTYTVLIEGTALPSNFGVTHVQVNRCLNRISFAKLRLIESDVASQQMEVSDQDLFSPGKSIEIKAGYHGDEETVFKGIIIRHGLKIKSQQAPVVEIECKDEAVKMVVDRKNRYFFEQSDGEIIEAIAGEHGLSSEVDDPGVSHPEMVQYFATDWDFVVARAEATARYVSTKDNTLVVLKPDLEQDAKFVLTYGSSIFEFEAEMDARDQYPSARIAAWNPDDQALREAEANADGVSSLGGGLGGVLGAAAGAVAGAAAAVGISLPGQPPNTDYTQTLGIDFFRLQHGGHLSDEEVQKWAEAQFQKSQLAKLRGRVRFDGVADIYPGDSLELQGVGLRHNGTVYVTAIRHEIGEGKWLTDAQFGLPPAWFIAQFEDVLFPPAAALLPAVHGLQIGVVTAVGPDPDGQDRIRVRLPLIDNVSDGIWVRIAAQDAGDSRGAFWRPELDDEVVVGFLQDDPREAVVLGMMHSAAKPAPLTASDANPEKGWITRSEMKLIFNDDQTSLTIESPGGKKIVIDDTAGHIELSDENNNRITLDQNGITIEAGQNLVLKAANSVTVEGVDISQSATGQLTAEGNVATLSATGSTTVRGNPVQIN